MINKINYKKLEMYLKPFPLQEVSNKLNFLVVVMKNCPLHFRVYILHTFSMSFRFSPGFYSNCEKYSLK